MSGCEPLVLGLNLRDGEFAMQICPYVIEMCEINLFYLVQETEGERKRQDPVI